MNSSSQTIHGKTVHTSDIAEMSSPDSECSGVNVRDGTHRQRRRHLVHVPTALLTATADGPRRDSMSSRTSSGSRSNKFSLGLVVAMNLMVYSEEQFCAQALIGGRGESVFRNAGKYSTVLSLNEVEL